MSEQEKPAKPRTTVVIAGHYRVLSVLGEGGNAIVYKAQDQTLCRLVAIKVMKGGLLSSPSAVERFRREAKLAASLRHPNIVNIHEFGLHQGRHFLVMDYIEGPTLEDVRRAGPLPLELALQIIREAAEALAYAHGRGIIHRDIKPMNIIIDRRGRPLITDFGLALSEAAGDEGRVTTVGTIMGTPYYLSPEQAEGAEDLDHRTDIYSLGVTLYFLLTGQVPFQGDTVMTILRRVSEGNPEPPRRLEPKVPKPVEGVCLKAMARRREDRFESAAGFARALAAAAAGRTPAGVRLRQTRLWLNPGWMLRLKVGRRAAWILVLLAVAVGALVGYGQWQKWAEADRQEELRLRREKDVAALIANAGRELDAGRPDLARTRLETARQLDPDNERLAALEERLANAVGVADLELLQREVRRAWDEIRVADPEHGVGRMLAGIFDDARAADALANRREFAAAHAAYTEVLAACESLKLLLDRRRAANEARFACWEEKRQATEAGGPDAEPAWAAALAAESGAAATFAAGDFDQALAAFGEAGVAFARAGALAAARREFREARAALPGEPVPTDSPAWQPVAGALEAAAAAEAAGDFGEATGHWQRARELLPAARQAARQATLVIEILHPLLVEETLELTLDGERYGLVRHGERIEGLAVGLHQVRLARPGWETSDGEADLTAGENILVPRLTPLPVIFRLEILNEEAAAKKARVFLGNRDLGGAGEELALRPFAAHLLAVKAKGYATVTLELPAASPDERLEPRRLRLEPEGLPADLTASPPAAVPREGLAAGSEAAARGQEEAAARLGLPVQAANAAGIQFRLVPAGEFERGSPEDERGRQAGEEGATVTIGRPFYLGVAEVTQAQWEQVMEANPSFNRDPDRPVEQVSWNDIQEFLARLAAREGAPAGTYRLPTEAEWEYACRAGTRAAFYAGDCRLPAGRDPALARCGWFRENSGGETHRVRQLEPNAWGFYDLCGNVAEWCADWHAPYGGESTDPAGPAEGENRVIRGGSWRDEAGACRAAARASFWPGNRDFHLGFRVVRELSAEPRP